MKYFRKQLAFVLILVMTIISIMPAQIHAEELIEVGPKAQNSIDSVFDSNRSDAIVIDRTGNDITKEFIKNNIDLYAAGNYPEIVKQFIVNDWAIQHINTIDKLSESGKDTTKDSLQYVQYNQGAQHSGLTQSYGWIYNSPSTITFYPASL